MWYGFPSRLFLGLGLLLGGVFGTAYLGGQPPGKGPKGPPLAEYVTVRGTVKEVTTALKGEVDGLILNDGTWVHWPPHLEDRFKNLATRGDRVKATGYWETGPRGDTKLEVATLTNVATGKSSDNPDRPPQAGAAGRLGRTGDIEDRLQALEDKIDQLTREVERLRRAK